MVRPVHTDTVVAMILFQVSVRNVLSAVMALEIPSLILSQISRTAVRKPSLVFQRYNSPATRAATAAMMIPMGLASMIANSPLRAVPTAVMAPIMAGAICMIEPMPVMTLPTTMSTGPKAAISKPTVTIIFCAPSSKELSQSTKD